MLSEHEISLEQAQHYLANLDLSYIVKAMCATTYALPRWCESDALECVKRYKNFLWLKKKYPQYKVVPTREIDEFWHNHILHTQQYFKDCLAIFGRYFHHRPAAEDENKEALAQAYLRTKALYLAEFGEAMDVIKG